MALTCFHSSQTECSSYSWKSTCMSCISCTCMLPQVMPIKCNSDTTILKCRAKLKRKSRQYTLIWMARRILKNREMIGGKMRIWTRECLQKDQSKRDHKSNQDRPNPPPNPLQDHKYNLFLHPQKSSKRPNSHPNTTSSGSKSKTQHSNQNPSSPTTTSNKCNKSMNDICTINHSKLPPFLPLS